MVNRILRLPDVKAATGLSRSTIYLRVSQGSFPRPISLGGGSQARAVGWLDSDIEQWIERQVQASRSIAFQGAQADSKSSPKLSEKNGGQNHVEPRAAKGLYSSHESGTNSVFINTVVDPEDQSIRDSHLAVGKTDVASGACREAHRQGR